MLALQELGNKLLDFSKVELDKLQLDATLREALDTARRIKSREGLRRQMQFIGKLMRQTDTSAIEQAIEEKEQGKKELTRRFHALENLRDLLVEKGTAGMELVIEQFPDIDRQHLRNLLMQADKERKNNKPPAASRKLFKYLRELDEQQPGTDI
ncbi:DUF615 domain-containing protein [Spongiibacter sp. KMU-158]|uniref:DUF615 domain-containing protein n=2 Tax=Spongiibacter pelagi TaxID=2760804 RepID=A0A927GX19_9GAMM|nr:DUF615 domain-containing protein [Spongiibacter pelagi]